MSNILRDLYPVRDPWLKYKIVQENLYSKTYGDF